MSNWRIPASENPIADRSGRVTTPWRQFFEDLAAAGSVAELLEAVRDLAARVRELDAGNFLPASTSIQGPGSVQVDGVLSNGVVLLGLVGDDPAPAPRHYYGTGVTGERGYHPLPSGGYLPMTTGEIVDGQPVFLHGPDGRLIYGPVS